MATRVSMVFDQGTTFETTIELVDSGGHALDVTGLAATAQMRRYYNSTNAISFSTNLSNGSLILSLSPTQTDSILAGRYVFDIELKDASNNVSRLIEGIVTVTPSVTRS